MTGEPSLKNLLNHNNKYEISNREKEKNARLIIKMQGQTTSIEDPDIPSKIFNNLFSYFK